MIIKIQESEETLLENINISDFPYNLPKAIKFLVRSGGLFIRVDGYSGSFSLKNGITIQIIPKIGDSNFFYLLYRTKNRLLAKKYESSSLYFASDNKTFVDTAASELFITIDKILSQGVLYGRICSNLYGNYARGKINTLDTIRRVGKGERRPVHYRIKEKTKDIPENRVITEAIKIAYEMIDTKEKNRYKPILISWINKFRNLHIDKNDLDLIQKKTTLNKISSTRVFYGNALFLSCIILGVSGYNILGEKKLFMNSTLMNTNDVFEKYLFSVIYDKYFEKNYSVSKGFLVHESLYVDGNYKIVPDIIISKNHETIMIIDAKYKNITNHDHYQLLSYLMISNTKVGVLISPNSQSDTIEKQSFFTENGIRVWEVLLPLSPSSIKESEAFLENILEELA